MAQSMARCPFTLGCRMMQVVQQGGMECDLYWDSPVASEKWKSIGFNLTEEVEDYLTDYGACDFLVSGLFEQRSSRTQYTQRKKAAPQYNTKMPGPLYYSRPNQFERFRGFLELISRFEFEFCRCVNFFLKDSNFWCVHVNVPWPVCAHAIPFGKLWLP